MDKNNIIRQKEKLIAQIKEYSPLFAPFFDLDMSLLEYSKSIYNFDKNDVYIERQKQLKNILSDKFRKLFPALYESLNIKYDDQMACNIVDHNQVLNHPLLISSNVIANVDKMLQNKKQNAIITISSGDVPPNNYFSKNGFVFHGNKVPIFTNKEKEYSSNLIPKIDFDFINNIKKQKRTSKFTIDDINYIKKVQSTIQGLDYSNCNNYNDQISVIVRHQWPELFEEKLRPNLPDLLYISQEEITTSCLLELMSEENIITYVLFNKEFRNKVIDAFRGIVVTWNEKETKGTHFFWRKHPNESRSIRMYLNGDKLIPEDNRYKSLEIKLDKDNVIELLKRGEIYPSLFIIFLVINFYYGIKPLVGQGSLTYLNLIRNKWLEILKDTEYKSEINLINSYEIDKLITGIIIFFEKNNDSLKTLWAHDIFYSGGVKEDYLNNLFRMPFKDLLSTAIVGIYDYVGKKYVPKEKLLKPTVTSDDLANLVFKWL